MPLALWMTIDRGGNSVTGRESIFDIRGGIAGGQRFLRLGPIDRDADEQPQEEGKEQAVAAKQIVHDVFNHEAEGKLRAASSKMG